MSAAAGNLHPIFDSILAPVRPIVATPEPVTMTTGDGFMVISRTRQPKSVVPPYQYDFHYDHFPTEADATEFYGEIERGDYGRSREPMCLVACLRGVPLGAKRILP